MPPTTPASWTTAAVQAPAAPFLIQSPANTPQNAEGDGSLGDVLRAPGSWLTQPAQ